MSELSRKESHPACEPAFCDIKQSPASLCKIQVGPVGFEHPPVAVSKTLISEGGGAKSDARCAPKAPKDPDLDMFNKAWPELPGHIKAAIKALIQTQNKP
jgi:hypothetical protein